MNKKNNKDEKFYEAMKEYDEENAEEEHRIPLWATLCGCFAFENLIFVLCWKFGLLKLLLVVLAISFVVTLHEFHEADKHPVDMYGHPFK